MVILDGMTWRLSFICGRSCIHVASCTKETFAFQCLENISALIMNLELNSIIDVWMLFVFSMTATVLCKVLDTAW